MRLGCPGPRDSTLTSDLLEPALRLFILGKPSFIETKCRSVVIPAPIDHPRGMLYVKHFVIKDVFNKPLGHLSRVKRLANRDCLVNPIVMAEDAARFL